MSEALARIDHFVADTRQAISVRRADSLLFLRPEKTLPLNESALTILEGLYRREAGGAAAVLAGLAPRLGVDPARLERDADELIATLGALLREDFSPRENLRFTPFDGQRLRYPVLAEIALTYGCQNRCAFCYAASPHRATHGRTMSTAEVQRVIEKIAHQAHVPTLSFTGGESTLRADLPALIRHGRDQGLRVNLITNGLRAADEAYARSLVEPGLDSAQVSLEAADPALHDRVVGRPGAFARTTAGIRAFQRLGIHVHTNTTLCAANLEAAPALVRFVARELGLPTLSMNLLIRTGQARAADELALSYTALSRRLPALLETARQEGVRLVWYSPIPYCIFNPVLHGLGAKSCACVSGILSVDPAGEVLPCSSFAAGLGSLLHGDYARIRESRAATYWRRRRYLPPPCAGCAEVDLCAGACPLYWDAAGSFAELPRPGADDPTARRRWERARRRGRSFGVPAADGPAGDVAADGDPPLPVAGRDADATAERATPTERC